MGIQVLFLATAESTKLQPIANTVPIPLLPIANRPVMLYPLELLARQNCKRFFVALYNHAGHIESYFGTGERWGVNLHYLLQRKTLGSGGSVKQAAAFAPDDLILVVPGDMIIDFDVSDLAAFHQERRALVTVLVHAEGPDNGCMVLVDEEGRVRKTGNGRTTARAAYDTGLYLIDPQAIDLIPAQKYCSIHSHLLPLLLAKELPVYAYESDLYWNSLSSFAAYDEAQAMLLRNEEPANDSLPILGPHWRKGHEVASRIWIGRNNVIHPAARLQPPVMIGNNCYIGQGVQLGPGAIVGDNVIIDEDATLSGTTVLNETYVGQLVKLENRLVNKEQVIDLISGEAVQITDQFLLGRTYQSVSDAGFFRFLDRFIALSLLLSLSWLMVLITILLWLTMRRVFTRETYIQGDIEAQKQSNTFATKHLSLWQFITNDRKGRQTALGHWLKQWDLYRLPHLWHVVAGDIALVGVKPLTEEETTFVQEEWQQKRFEHMMGFTGLWYVQPHQLDSDGIDNILVADTYYTVTQTWQLDFKIIWQTLPAWWRRSRQNRMTSRRATI